MSIHVVTVNAGFTLKFMHGHSNEFCINLVSRNIHVKIILNGASYTKLKHFELLP